MPKRCLLWCLALFLVLAGPASPFFGGPAAATAYAAQALPIMVQPVAAETSVSYFIKSNGDLYACGGNAYGQLGDGTRQDKSTPVKILENALCVDSSYNKSYAITKDGDLYVWGSNTSRYSSNKTGTAPKPRKIMSGVWWLSCNLEGAMVITNSYDLYTISNEDGSAKFIMGNVKGAGRADWNYIIVKTDGTLWTWGDNSYSGILGDGTTEPRHTPKQIMSGVDSVACGSDHALALKTDGSVWAWGEGDMGQLGHGEHYQGAIPDNRPWGNDRYKPVKVAEGVKYIGACMEGSYAIKDDNSLWLWGKCFEGQRPVGYNPESPVKAGPDLPSTGLPFKFLEDVAYVHSDGNHMLAVRTDGTLWAWGINDSGKFGDGQTLFAEKPQVILEDAADISISDYYAMAVKNDGSVWAWGRLPGGRDTVKDETFYTGINSSTPVKVFEDAKKVSTSYAHVLMLKKDGTLWALGHNEYGKLGDGTVRYAAKPVKVMSGVADMEAGSSSSIALKTDGSLWAWGMSSHRQSGSAAQPPKKVADNVLAFTTTTVGWVYAGKDGRLYSARALESGSGVEMLDIWDESGRNSQPVTVPAGVTRITADRGGNDYTFALASTGELYDGSRFYDGQPFKKVMDNVKYMSGTETPYIVKTDGSLVLYGENKTVLTNIAKAEKNRLGAVLALGNDGKVYAWGRNDYGIIGNGTQAVRPIPAQYHSGILLSAADLQTLPSQNNGPTGPAPSSVQAVSTNSAVMINGKKVAFEAYNIGGNNYFKLRDLAMALSGSKKQFEVTWDGEKNAINLLTGKPYTPVGGELVVSGNTGNKEALPTTSEVYLDGALQSFTAFNIGGNNYFKLRDVGRAMDFGITWDGATNTIGVDTEAGYTH
jgi:alpha-tubulin suppressor-like RCC1 family protein